MIKDLSAKAGETVTIKGFVDVRRDQGKLVFFDFRDRSGTVQGVVLPGDEALMEAAKEIRNEHIVEVSGIVNKRPEKNVQAGKLNGDIELEVKGIRSLVAPAELPFDKDADDLSIETRFDYRPFTLRSQRDRDIFEVQATILRAFREARHTRDFTEFTAPVLVGLIGSGIQLSESPLVDRSALPEKNPSATGRGFPSAINLLTSCAPRPAPAEVP